MGLKRRNPARIRLFTTPATVAPRLVPAPVAEPKAAPPPRRLSSEERHTMISKIAYGIAERGGFRGDPLTNWLAAEREVDATLRA